MLIFHFFRLVLIFHFYFLLFYIHIYLICYFILLDMFLHTQRQNFILPFLFAAVAYYQVLIYEKIHLKQISMHINNISRLALSSFERV